MVIVSFHRPELLEKLIASVRGADIEIVVANVGEDQEVSRLLLEQQVIEVPVRGNPGYAAAVNQGVGAIRAPAIVFMNDDVVIDAENLRRLVARMDELQADAVVPRLCSESGKVERTIAPLPGPARLLVEWAILPDRPLGGRLGQRWVHKWRLPVQDERILAATGAIVATRRSLLESHPLPDIYFLYWEEQEWFWTLHQEGRSVWYCPDAEASHLGGREDVRSEKSALMARNAVRCVCRTRGRLRAALSMPVVVAWNLRLTMSAGARWLWAPSLVHRRTASARLAGLTAALGSWRELAAGRGGPRLR